MRNENIDFLRGVAVLMVLYAHMQLSRLIKFGWAGVDLFFVLSGFLVTGLLFHEIKKYGSINGKLFLIRRGFKIYPNYYLFLLIAIIFELLIPNEDRFWRKLIYEALFIQNYTELIGLHWHTWSLSVEEQFYFILVFIIFIFSKFKLIGVGKPYFFYFFLGIAIFCLTFRVITTLKYPIYVSDIHTYPTHLRIDSLLFGSLIAYYYSYYEEQVLLFFQKNYKILIAACLFCLSFSVFLPIQNNFMHTFGLTFQYLGNGILLILMVSNQQLSNLIKRITGAKIYAWIAKVGFYSYSIYLWHTFVQHYIIGNINIYITRIFANHLKVGEVFEFILYVFLSIFFGVIMGKLIEIPFLKLREIYFPKRSEAL